jgi:hypothetical protein
MKLIEISEELFEKLKQFVVDPFDDSPEAVISRLVDIVEKAKTKWISWDNSKNAKQQAESTTRAPKHGNHSQKQVEVTL